jgi:hypothetical protein
MDADTAKALKSLGDRIQVVARSLNDTWKAINEVEDKTNDNVKAIAGITKWGDVINNHANMINDLQQHVAKLEK